MLIINHMTRIYIPRMLESVIVRVITWGVRMGVWRVDPPFYDGARYLSHRNAVWINCFGCSSIIRRAVHNEQQFLILRHTLMSGEVRGVTPYNMSGRSRLLFVVYSLHLNIHPVCT